MFGIIFTLLNRTEDRLISGAKFALQVYPGAVQSTGYGTRVFTLGGQVQLEFAGKASALGGLLLEEALVFRVLDVLGSLPISLLSVFTGFDQLCNYVSDFSHLFLLVLM